MAAQPNEAAQRADHAQDRDARFTEVYSRTRATLMLYASRRANSQEASDFVAAAYEIAWRKIEVIPVGYEVQWLLAVLRRVLANHRRSSQARSRLTVLPRPPEPDAFEHVNLIQVLATLPEGQAALLLGTTALDRVELAALLRCSTNALKIRLHRARRAYAEALGLVS